MARAKKAVEAPKRRGRPPKNPSAKKPARKKRAPRTKVQPPEMAPMPPAGPGYKYRWISEKAAEDEGLIMRHEPIPLEEQAIELALVRLRRIAATLRLSTVGMDRDQSDAVSMAAELVDGANEAIAEALAMVQEQKA